MRLQKRMILLKKITNLLFPPIVAHRVINWIVKVEVLFLVTGGVFFYLSQGFKWACSFFIGGLLVFFNFLILARILPNLVVSKDARASIFTLLVNFYFKLLFTGLILILTIVFFKMPVYPLILGLSTIVVALFFGIGKHIMTLKEKEANIYVRSSSSRITS